MLVVATTSPRPLVKGARGARSTIALKMLMAVSGSSSSASCCVHMYGNLKAFAGHDAFNEYAEHLRDIGEPMLPHEGLLWIMRVGLIVALVVHVSCAVVLWRRAGQARTERYVVKKNTGSTLSSRTDALGRPDDPAVPRLAPAELHDRQGQRAGRRHQRPLRPAGRHVRAWWMTLIYLSRWSRSALHLHHGVWSAAQTLGLTNNARARRNAKGSAGSSRSSSPAASRWCRSSSSPASSTEGVPS